MQPNRTAVLVLLTILLVTILTFAVVMAFEVIARTLQDQATAVALRWTAGTLGLIAVVDAILLLICVAVRSLGDRVDS